MSALECQETPFQLWVIEKVVQELARKDPALLNHDRHVSIAIAELASNVVRNPVLDPFHFPRSCPDVVRRPHGYVRLFDGNIVPASVVDGDPFDRTCHVCHVVLTYKAEAYPVPAAVPRHWKANCSDVRFRLCRPCHEIVCRCGTPATPGLLYATASYEQ